MHGPTMERDFNKATNCLIGCTVFLVMAAAVAWGILLWRYFGCS